ncbi:MAG: M42 family peptidase [Clostridia bacterium]|nr:M42 family peptidase [Clostridia bacterium]
MLELIKELSNLPGISGRENSVRDYIIEKIKDYAEYSVDPLGNLLVFKKGKNRPSNKVMIDAHMDEVGYLVTGFTADGCLNVINAGGIDPRVVIGRAAFVGKNAVQGVFGIKPGHLLDSVENIPVPKTDALYIDIGAKDRAEAEEYVSLGDSVWFDSDFVEFGDGFVKAKALDDRVGCALMIEMIRSELEYDMWFSFSVQEEIGTRGAATAAFTIAPDYAIAVETTTAADVSGVKDEKRVCICGNGGVVSFMDRSTLYSKDLFDRAFEIAKEKNIAIQTKTVVAGGNDSGAIHKSRGGVKVLTVSVPCRYLHSPGCVIKYTDALVSLKLVKALAEDFAK